MRIALGAAALGVAAVGIGITMTVFGASSYRLAAVAPANTSVWIEVRDVAGTLAAFRQSPSFADYGRSASKKQVDKAWEQLLSLNESEGAAEWKAMGLPLSERSILLALGQNVGLGAIVVGDAPPSAFVATKIDVIGLAKDVAVDGDWTKVWERLRGSLGGKDATVEPYQGYDLVTRKLPEAELHFSMLRDVLVASLDKDTVKALIEVQAGSRESLAEKKSFSDEVDGLAEDYSAYAWFDLELVRDKTKMVAAVKRVAERLGAAKAVEKFDGEELAVLQEDLAPVNGLAIGFYVPKGELYAAHVDASRAEDELFRDCARHDLRELLGEDTFVYVEARGLYDLGRRVIDSEALAALSSSQAVKWAREQLERPGELPMDVRRAAPLPIDADPTFEARVALALAAIPLREVLGNDIALAVETHDAKTPEEALRPLAFVRSRPLVRMVVDVASGVLAAETKRAAAGSTPTEVTTHAGRTIFGVTKPTGVYWTQVGAELAISTRKDMLQRVIDRAAPNGAPPGELQASIKRLPEGYTAFFYMDMRKNRQLAKNLTAGSGEAAQVEKLDAFVEGLDAQAMGFYVNEECTAYTVRTWQHLGEKLDPSLRKVYDHALTSKDAEPAAWTRLPEETWLSLAGQTDPQALWDYALRLAKATVGEKQVADGLAAVSKELLAGQDPQAALVEPLGSNVGWGVLSQPRLGAAPDKDVIAVPASVLALQLKDPQAALTFEKALDALLATALKKVNERRGGGDEKWAATQLRALASAETLFFEGDKEQDSELDYGALDELAMTDLIGWDVASGSAQGWTFELKVTDPTSAWIATARQNDAAPDAPTLVIDQDCVVKEVAGRLELDDQTTMPGTAVALGTLPRAERTVDPNDPRLVKLATFDLGGTQATRLELPARDREQLEEMFGKGFTPCFAFAGGWLHVATSEHALTKTLASTAESGSLAKSPAFRRLIGGHPTRVVMLSHLSWSGLTVVARENAERLARDFAPLPPELKLPARPEFPEVTEGQADMDKVFAKFQEESEAYEKTVAEHAPRAAEWRKAHATENAGKLVGPLSELLSLLGGVISYSTVDPDGRGLESVVEVRLDPTAVAPAAR